MFFTPRTENGKPYLLTLLVLAVLLLITIVLAARNGGPVGAADSFPPNIHVATVRTAPGIQAVAAIPAAPGVLDPTFGDVGQVTTDLGSGLDHAHAIAIGRDGKIVLAGESRANEDARTRVALARYNKDGSLDGGFGDGGKVVARMVDESFDTSVAHAVAIQPDGKIVVAGTAHNPQQYHSTFAVARFNADGSLDPGFGDGGRVLTAVEPTTGYGREDIAYAMLLQPDGKIVVGGETGGFPRNFALARYNKDGSLDTGFGAGGLVITDADGNDSLRALALQPDGKIVAAGRGHFNDNDWVVTRYLPDGALDPAFGDGGGVITDFLGGMDWAGGVAVRPNGKIVVGGLAEMYCQGTCSKWGFAVAQYNADGSLDAAFGDEGKVHYDFVSSTGAYGMALRPDGKVVLVGHSGNTDFAVAVYNVNGTLDASFGDGGLARTSFGGQIDRASAVAVQADGKIVVAGEARMGDSDAAGFDFALARYQVRGGLTRRPQLLPGE